MTIQNTEKSKRRARRETFRLLALCAVLCVPLIGIAPVRDAAYRAVYRIVPPLQQKANVELLQAAQSDDLTQVKLLVAHGANVNFKDASGVTPLMSAISLVSRADETLSPIAKFLVQNGANPNANAPTQQSLFFYVAENATQDEREPSYAGYAELLQAMLDKGITPTQKYTLGDVLYHAVRFGTEKNVRDLLAQGADVNAEVRTRGSGPSTILLAAVHELRPEMVRLLLEHGANSNAVGSIYDTSAIEPPLLHLLAEMNYAAPLSEKGSAIVRLLLEHGTDVNAFTSEVNPKTFEVIQNHFGKGWAALTYAAIANDLPTVQLLVQHGANPNLRDKDGKTALDYARRYKQTNVIRVLENATRTRK